MSFLPILVVYQMDQLQRLYDNNPGIGAKQLYTKALKEGLQVNKRVVDDLIAQKQEGIEQPKVNLVGWKKVAKSGNAYLRIIANMEKERKDNQKEKVEQKPTEDKSDDEIDDPIPF